MIQTRVGALLAMAVAAPVGIVSDRDTTRKGNVMGHVSKDTPVSEVMSQQVVTVAPDTSLRARMENVTRHHIRRLPVVKCVQVLGILSIGDLLGAMVHPRAEANQTPKAFFGSDDPNGALQAPQASGRSLASHRTRRRPGRAPDAADEARAHRKRPKDAESAVQHDTADVAQAKVRFLPTAVAMPASSKSPVAGSGTEVRMATP
jgi:hypothetical protein